MTEGFPFMNPLRITIAPKMEEHFIGRALKRTKINDMKTNATQRNQRLKQPYPTEEGH